jgi:hypothetical protein
VPAIIVCPPVVTAYLTVPPHVLPVVSGAPDILEVEIVPLLDIVDSVPPRANVDMSSEPPVVVVKLVFTVTAPLAVLVPVVFRKLRPAYVPLTRVWPPAATSYLTVPVPPHVLLAAIGVAEVLDVAIIPLLVMVANEPPSVAVDISNVLPAFTTLSKVFTTKLPEAVLMPPDVLLILKVA